jgi:hypothetical protein
MRNGPNGHRSIWAFCCAFIVVVLIGWYCSIGPIQFDSLRSHFSGLGVDLSKVRSLHMDSWDLETLMVMSELGNTVVNSIYEAHLPDDCVKAQADSDP